jgi:hypothetical protein
VRAADLDSAA